MAENRRQKSEDRRQKAGEARRQKSEIRSQKAEGWKVGRLEGWLNIRKERIRGFEGSSGSLGIFFSKLRSEEFHLLY